MADHPTGHGPPADGFGDVVPIDVVRRARAAAAHAHAAAQLARVMREDPDVRRPAVAPLAEQLERDGKVTLAQVPTAEGVLRVQYARLALSTGPSPALLVVLVREAEAGGCTVDAHACLQLRDLPHLELALEYARALDEGEGTPSR